MPFAPWQQVIFNSAVAEIARNLIGGAAIAIENTEQVFHVTDLEMETPQAPIFPAEHGFSNAFTAPENSVIPFGQCNR